MNRTHFIGKEENSLDTLTKKNIHCRMPGINYNFASVDEYIEEFEEGDENLYDDFKTAAEAIRTQVSQLNEVYPNFLRGVMLIVLLLFVGQVSEEQFNNAFVSHEYDGLKEAVNAYKELIETLYGDNDIYLDGAYALIAKQVEHFPFVEEPVVPAQPEQPAQPPQQIGEGRRKTRRHRKVRKSTRRTRNN